mgnify:FL=1
MVGDRKERIQIKKMVVQGIWARGKVKQISEKGVVKKNWAWEKVGKKEV